LFLVHAKKRGEMDKIKLIKITNDIELYNNKVETTVPALDDNSVDLIITSPPYNVDLGNNKFNKNSYDICNDKLEHSEYIKWLKGIFKSVYPKLKTSGRIAINIGDGANGKVTTHVDITHFMVHELKYLPMANIIWNKSQVGNRTAWGCYDEQTKVLTNNGLKYFKDVNIKNDLFATINLKTQKLEYQKAFNYIEKPYNGEMCKIKTRTADLLVTPNHNMVLSDKKNNLYKEEAINLYNKPFRISKRHKGFYHGKNKDFFELPPVRYGKRTKKKYINNDVIKINMDDWLRFLGIFFTDGNVDYSTKRGCYKVSIYQSKKKYLNDIENLLKRLPFKSKYKKSKSEYYICNKQLAEYLHKFKNKNNREIPNFIFNLSLKQKEIFVQWLFIGDGNSYKNKKRSIAVSSDKFTDSLLNILLQLNYKFSTHKQLSEERVYKGKLIRANRPINIIGISYSNHFYFDHRTGKNRKNSTSLVDYKGKVYCVSVPNGTLFVERNGKFTWCGNSFKSPSCPSFPKPFEYIMLFAKEDRKLQEKGETDLTNREFIDWSLAIWNVAPETKMKEIGHPAVFPVSLPRRLIKMLSWKNATILDIFNGSGTTGVACKELGRKYIGIEMSKKYCDITIKRINNTKSLYEMDMFAT